MKFRKSVMFPTHALIEPSAIEHLKRVLKKDCGEEIMNTLESKGGFSYDMEHTFAPDPLHETRLTATADFGVLEDRTVRAVEFPGMERRIDLVSSKYEDEINDLKKQLAEANKRIDTLEQIILQHYTSLTDYE